MNTTRFTSARSGLLALLIAALCPFTANADDSTQSYDIEAQPMDRALKAFAAQTEIQVAFSPDTVDGLMAQAVQGDYVPESALRSLIDETGLDYEFASEKLVVVRAPQAAGEVDETSGKFRPASRPVLMAQNQTSAERSRTKTTSQATNDEDEEEIALEEIVVTGSNIRGVQGASPVFIFDRDTIDQAGVSTVIQFIETLPQNFSGGIKEIGTGTNANFGSGVNLRGLGNDSTLVLLNGRRLAPAGAGNFVDISMIPLTAVDRIEVLTDGASAIYGSDAVGGVVNFRLRDDYEGAETRLRYGTATSGDLDDIQVGQTFGTTWDTGHGLISYEYQKRDALDANDRVFTEDELDPTDLLPQQKRYSFFLTGGQSLSESLEVFVDTYYSKRDTVKRSASRVSGESAAETEQYGASLGVMSALGRDWRSELVGSFSQSDVVSPISFAIDGHTSISQSLEGKVDGSLFVLPGGDVMLAVGGQIRDESYKEDRSSLPEPRVDADRTIYSLYGEVFVPLVGEDNRRAGIERLELTVAGRYEDYSDAGDTTNPKFGVLWSPVAGLNLRGTYGTSFRAPLFRELFGTQAGILASLPDPSSASGLTLSLIGAGANSGLQPETAITWTAGFDLALTSLPGLNIQVTYFDIDFEDRIDPPGALFGALGDPRFAFAVDRNPDPGLLAFLGSSPSSFNLTGGVFDFTDAEVFIDNRMRNLSSVQTRGLDVTVAYLLSSDVGNFSFNLNSTRLFEQSEQLLPTDSAFNLVGTVTNPPDLKLRGSISWAYNRFSANLGANYIDGFRNEQVTPFEDVSSWTTVDMNISYNTGDNESGGWLNNTIFSLNALNLFDRDPPFAASAGFNRDFDTANASVLGRTIALQITKQW